MNYGERFKNSEIQINIPDDIDLKFAQSFENKSIILIHLIFKKK